LLETSEGMLSAVDVEVQLFDGPRWLSDYDDDDDDDYDDIVQEISNRRRGQSPGAQRRILSCQ